MKMFTDRYILTPGPTEIPYRIKLSLMRETTNPDLDPEFLVIYNNTRELVKEIIDAKKSSLYILLGEAMIGLEASVANTIKRGTKVLVIGNGVFGEGFAELIKLYGGEPIIIENCSDCWRRKARPDVIDRELEKNKDVEVVTLVHCDTPSAILNDAKEISKITRQHGVFLIVDAVSSIGGVPIHFDSSGIDILIGGSQKVLNVPVGLTILSIKNDAWDRIEKINYKGFYLDLKIWRESLDTKETFPYTMSDVLIYALNESLKMIIEEGVENVYNRHVKARNAVWRALEILGLEPYPLSLDDSSPTVTAFEPPRGISESEIRKRAWEKYGVMFAGSWGKLQGKILRLGHMGVQASRSHVLLALTTVAKVLRELGYRTDIGEVIEVIEEEFS